MNGIFALFLVYLIVPKIDILPGVRPEDLVFLAAFALYLLKERQGNLLITKSMKLYLIFIVINLTSAAINFELNGSKGFLYSLRLFQYVLWYPIMWKGCQDLTKEQIVRGFTGISAILFVWGMLEFTGMVPKIGNFVGATGRLSLNTGGPYEAAVMIAMLGYIVNGIVLTPLLLVIVVLTQARITTAAVAIGYIITRPGRTALLAIIAGTAALLLSPQIDSMLKGSRYQAQESQYSMIGLIRYEWDVVPTFTDPSLFRDAFIENLADLKYMPDKVGDLSFNIRAVRWPIVYKSVIGSPISLLIGFGPGAWGNALDGYHARLAGEVGLLGIIVFVLWFLQLLRESRKQSVVFYSLIVISISSIFIDIFVSSKVMPLLWVFAVLQAIGHPASQVGDWRGLRNRGGGGSGRTGQSV
ncbi:hypothetical protein ASE75_14825 [Sphingomonas sp. Leaf17]|uniref:hypothetical protein n=1 Tax=Sphingomonas sp. Leaf17 TaxID=1735683 RepID=UPI0006F7190E|nr:hypothetical protein [Sphingomonas sp. Leaf17]KQM62009.1 hypothetical protein ASE75_14825 [Sphingomonas sp. Leaf17]